MGRIAIITKPINIPWAVTIAKVGGVYVAQINRLSYLMNSRVLKDHRTINNLTSNIQITQSASSTDFLYLEQSISSYSASGNALVNSGSVGATFDPTKQPWDSGGKAYLANDGATPPNQTFFRILLATIATGPSIGGVVPALIATPCCTTHLLIANTDEGFLPAINAIPAAVGS